MGSRISRNYNAAYPRVDGTERNSPNALLNGYQMRQNEYMVANMHHQSRFSPNGLPIHHTGNSVVNGSIRIGYNNVNSKHDSFPVKENDIGFRNGFLEGNDINRCSKRPPISKSTLLQELLECPICMNLYENPHVLPCQHTFCKKCLILLNNESNSKTTLDCPICREVKYKYSKKGFLIIFHFINCYYFI